MWTVEGTAGDDIGIGSGKNDSFRNFRKSQTSINACAANGWGQNRLARCAATSEDFADESCAGSALLAGPAEFEPDVHDLIDEVRLSVEPLLASLAGVSDKANHHPEDGLNRITARIWANRILWWVPVKLRRVSTEGSESGAMNPENRRKLNHRIRQAAEAALSNKEHVSAIDVLVGIGWLAPSNVDAWRQKRIGCLEQAINAKSAAHLRGDAPVSVVGDGQGARAQRNRLCGTSAWPPGAALQQER